ncbi:SNRPN upstream reading frame protein-like [Sturnira hondurensis]|uniref:SNRPN upstream reading frame protein-like n=1 Tax=Sturnira hondurensis TaxID=192404 RepID=UPI00187AABEF|nr:SNRPN upstream reading frame protein-like [Sturnira hondurensis]
MRNRARVIERRQYHIAGRNEGQRRAEERIGEVDRRLYRDRLHLRRTTEQHVPEVEVQVKQRRTASLSNQECQLYTRRSQQQQQQQQVPVVDFQAELRQAFLAETPRGG